MRWMLLTLGPVACTGGESTFGGFSTWQYLELDGERTWKYRQDDSDIDWRMEVTKSAVTARDGLEVVTLDYGVLDPAELLYTIDWSSTSTGGIQIFGYTVEGGEAVVFDTPVVFAEHHMSSGDTAETATNGATYVSELVGVEVCENDWVTEPWDCLHFRVSDGTDDATSAPFVGEWWLAADWGASRFQPAGYDAPWILSEALWSSDEG